MPVSPDEVRQIALSLPEVEEGVSYGHQAFKAFGKFLTRIRGQDDSIVFVGVGFDEREMLMEAEPEIFHVTPHYRDYPAVLARLATVDPGTVRSFLERRWRECAPRKFLKAYDAAQTASD
jgi:hypothetical protein